MCNPVDNHKVTARHGAPAPGTIWRTLGPSRFVDRRAGDAPWALGPARRPSAGAGRRCQKDAVGAGDLRMRARSAVSASRPEKLRFSLRLLEGIGCCSPPGVSYIHD